MTNKTTKNHIQLSTLILCIYIFLSPLDMILNLTGSGTILKYIGMLLAPLIVLESIMYRKKLNINFSLIFIGLYWLYYALGYFWSIDLHQTFWALISLGNLIALVAFLSLRKYNIKEFGLIKLSSIASMLFFTYRMINEASQAYYGRGTIGINGVFIDPNDIAAAFIIPFLFCIDKLNSKNKGSYKILYLFSLIIIGYGLLLTGSRGGILAIGVASVAYYILNSDIPLWKSIIRVISMSLVALLIFTALFSYLPMDVQNRLSLSILLETGGTGRLDIWKQSLEVFSSSSFGRLFIGYGLSTFSILNSARFNTDLVTHNIYLQTLLDAGVGGVILLLVMCLWITMVAYRNKNWVGLSIFVGTLVMSLTLDTWNKKFFWNAVFIAIVSVSSSYIKKSKR